MRQYLSSVKDGPSQATIDKVFNSLPPELAAIPEVANLVDVIAEGLDAKAAKQAKRAAQPPVVPTESIGGSRPGAGESMTDMDHRFKEAAGVSAKEWKEASGRYKPGQINILES